VVPKVPESCCTARLFVRCWDCGYTDWVESANLQPEQAAREKERREQGLGFASAPTYFQKVDVLEISPYFPHYFELLSSAITKSVETGKICLHATIGVTRPRSLG
jgi:hypothetical protein